MDVGVAFLKQKTRSVCGGTSFSQVMGKSQWMMRNDCAQPSKSDKQTIYNGSGVDCGSLNGGKQRKLGCMKSCLPLVWFARHFCVQAGLERFWSSEKGG